MIVIIPNLTEQSILEAAREIVAKVNDKEFPGLARAYRNGRSDDSEEIRIAIAAIKHGIGMAVASGMEVREPAATKGGVP